MNSLDPERGFPMFNHDRHAHLREIDYWTITGSIVGRHAGLRLQSAGRQPASVTVVSNDKLPVANTVQDVVGGVSV